LPSGTYTYSVRHDPVPGVADEGIPIKAIVTVDSEQGLITVDARDNPDTVAGGLNLSEACAVAACRIGVFYNVDSEMPHNHGSASRILPLLRDGCVVGRPTYPAGTSVATSNCMERLANAVQCSFTRMGAPYGMAEGGGNFSAALGVVSGRDGRQGEPIDYITQFIMALSGGPGLSGHDGWLTYEASSGNGIMVCDSVEVNEAMYPIVFGERRIAIDTLGPGQWCGAPATQGTYRSLDGDILVYYCGDGGTFPAAGVLGGGAGATSGTWKRHRAGDLQRLPDFHNEVFAADQDVVYRSCAGGGYGSPRNREAARVCLDVNRHWVSVDNARNIFCVSVKLAANGVDYEVDERDTAQLRQVT
jgi:N-methylhydantoinase B